MYGLPDDFDPTVFVGRTLQRLTFTVNTLEFSFDGDVSIIAECEVQHEGQDDRGVRWTDSSAVPIRQSRLMSLLENRIVSGAVERPGTLVLEFATGHTLRCVDDSDQYESYQLRIGADEIIV